mmetsp:Transcript_28662/g.64011  ORF Transcript_28662/g.64011 Transcript_28662/m.64011 type:complete len:214 (-) Transcript_28662:1999-2640(-)
MRPLLLEGARAELVEVVELVDHLLERVEREGVSLARRQHRDEFPPDRVGKLQPVRRQTAQPSRGRLRPEVAQGAARGVVEAEGELNFQLVRERQRVMRMRRRGDAHRPLSVPVRQEDSKVAVRVLSGLGLILGRHFSLEGAVAKLRTRAHEPRLFVWQVRFAAILAAPAAAPAVAGAQVAAAAAAATHACASLVELTKRGAESVPGIAPRALQ